MRRLALDPTDIPAVQAWLEDWAARGWYLKTYGRNLASFVPGERQEHIRYRLQPVGAEGGEADWDTREAYREMGWTYVCSTIADRGSVGVRTEFHIWRCDDPEAPELDTDQALREEAYGDLLRRGWRNIWMGVPLIAAVLAVMWWLVWSHPREYLLEGHPDSTILMLCCNVLLTLHLVDRAVRLIRFTRRLRQEEPAPQRAPWGRARARVWVFQGLYALILMVMIGNLFRPYEHRPYLPVSQYDRPVPYVSLAELGTPAAGEAEAVDFHSVWAKSVWWTLEGDYKHLEGDYENPPYCSAEYYSLRFFSMAENLEEQLLRRWAFAVDVGEHPEFRVSLPGTDSAWYCRDELEEWQFLLLRRGRQVLDVSYLGEADLMEHADLYVEMLERAR